MYKKGIKIMTEKRKATDIIKLVYKSKTVDPVTGSISEMETVTIYPDGKILFNGKDNGESWQNEEKRSKEAFCELCAKIEECIKTASECKRFCDCRSGNLKIYRKYGHTEQMDRGFGNENTDIFSIINGFLCDEVE